MATTDNLGTSKGENQLPLGGGDIAFLLVNEDGINMPDNLREWADGFAVVNTSVSADAFY